ncbi:hypothetical protein ACQCVK_10680 [Rossellomorea vietnamensis]|uniref:hypothetical protein n=1 Tax=Rossellomorea vietnamensis TaxID=218284 RepID=UPI003CEAB191
MKLINLRQLQELYTTEGARTVFERLTALILQNYGRNLKSIRVQRGDGGVDSFEGDYGAEITVYQCKYFIGNIDKTQKEQIKKSLNVALNNGKFKLKRWVLCIPKNLSEAEQSWFSEFKKTIEKDNDIMIDYIGEDFYINELLKDKNKEIRNHIFKEQYELILGRVEEALNRLSNKEKNEHDEKFLYKVLKELNEEHFLKILEKITTYGSYSKYESTKIATFLFWSQRPSNCFINGKVEKKYRKFITNLTHLRIFMSINFFKREDSLQIQDDEYYLYPDFNSDFGCFDKESNQVYDNYYEKLTEICNAVEKSYEKLIKKAKKEIF